MFALHQTLHETMGVCLWTMLTIAVLGIIVVVAGVSASRQKARNDKFNRDMEEKYGLSDAVERK